MIDFKSILECYNRNDELPAGVFKLPSNFEKPVFCLESRPGIVILLFIIYSFDF